MDESVRGARARPPAAPAPVADEWDIEVRLVVPVEFPKLSDYRDRVCAEAEKKYLSYLMTLANKDIPAACRLSGLSQSRLYSLLKSHELSRS